MPFTLGIDVGSRNTKLVVFDGDTHSIWMEDVQPTGVNPQQSVVKLLQSILPQIPSSDAQPPLIYATGYGRKLVKAHKTVSEISCHAAGVQYFFPDVRTVIDIGGQDSKVIALGANGRVKDFAMNDKCAAGTGRFLEMVALRLETTVDALAEMAAQADQQSCEAESIHLNSICVVFAETEIISLISCGTKPYGIARAVHLSIANRILSQVNQLAWESPVVFTGGVAFNNDLKAMLELSLHTRVYTPVDPAITGALGAALLAANES